ncbi:DUF6182 family protein [Amycolatopsis sp. NPDC059021]|uniref:DUF6182 family protein n=1 Tax=Amycolatopsis sp. NPDC059021 TaxID=3346704 RepID=UPI00367098A1
MLTQQFLRAELARRVSAARAGEPRLQAGQLPVPDLEQLAEAKNDAPDIAAVAVLRGFDPTTFVQSSIEFALRLDPRLGRSWCQAFTRTLFLAGNPGNLSGRFVFDHVSPDGSVAWTRPVPPKQSLGLRRLLRRFDGSVPLTGPAVAEVHVPGPARGRAHLLQVATAGVAVTDYLVHVNHVLAEAVVNGTLAPGDRLFVEQVPRLAPAARYSALRVDRDNLEPEKLRAYAGLSALPE